MNAGFGRATCRVEATWLAAIVLAAGGCAQVRPAVEPAGPHVRIMTYNVNYGGSPAAAMNVIEQGNADVVCLQETTQEYERYLRPGLASRYPHALFHHEPAAGGMAVLSREPIEELFYEQPVSGWFHGWGVRTRTGAGDLQFLNVHLHPPLSETGSVSASAYFSTKQTRRGEISQLLGMLSPGVPSVVLGDFNENDSGDAVHFLTQHQFTDSLRQFDRYTNTWQWPTSLVTLKGRYDHILYSPQLRCCDTRVLKAGESDHFPVVAVLQSASQPRGRKDPGPVFPYESPHSSTPGSSHASGAAGGSAF